MVTHEVLVGDALKHLRKMPDESVNCGVTSPPYWNLRDYGTATWVGGSADCDHLRGNEAWDNGASKSAGSKRISKTICQRCGARRIDQQIGLEETPVLYVRKLVRIFREVRRVLRSDGTLWINIGDSYSASGAVGSQQGKQATNRGSNYKPGRRAGTVGIKGKNLVGIPWRLAFALQDDGWYLRSAIIWAKPNGMPGSQTDRPTSSYEMVFLLSKSPRYWSDFDAIKTPPKESSLIRAAQDVQAQAGSHRVHAGGRMDRPMKTVGIRPASTTLEGTYRGRHSEGVVPAKERRNDKQRGHSRRHAGFNDRWDQMTVAEQQSTPAMIRDVWFIPPAQTKERHYAVMPRELARRCILAGCPEGGVVLDIFAGSGTTLEVALTLGRSAKGIELNPNYRSLIDKRLRYTTPGFVFEESA